MRPQLRGGKTPPRILQDLLLYNPDRLPPTGHNVLTDIGPLLDDDELHRDMTAKGSCRHNWAITFEQSTVADIDPDPKPDTLWSVVSYCTSCRYRLTLSINFKGKDGYTAPCPTKDYPMHHFLHDPGSSNRKYSTAPQAAWIDTQQFRCSAPSCPAILVATMQTPRLTQAWVKLLTNETVLKARAEKAMNADPERFQGHAIPSPSHTLINLQTYISNAMKNSEARKIQAHNKKWVLNFGEDCDDLLAFLGFERNNSEWIPPQPDPNDTEPYKTPLKILLNDVVKELIVLIMQRPYEERRLEKVSAATPQPAKNEFEKLMSCHDYSKNPVARTIDLTQEDLPEHPSYAGLGSARDVSDGLLIFSYERQIACDVTNIPYYLQCLQLVSEGRHSEELQTKVAIEASSGKISQRDIRNAYKELGLDTEPGNLNDDTIIGTFQARVSDALRQETDLRRALKIIGQNRHSEKIQLVAANSVTSYEQALAWLGAEEGITDEFVISIYSVKVNENRAEEPVARQAVQLIAEFRNSVALRHWLDTGVLGDFEMDAGQAYARLGISDRTIDDETILAAYEFHVTETPSQLDDLKRALTAIAKAKNSRDLQDYLDSGMVNSGNPLSEWPVGLENIGNTCYLNSLLQFYFAVKPLRELVLNFDEHKMPISEETICAKQVGSRKVYRKEVERAQRFVYELQKLFRSMITASKAQVIPEQELARLTLTSSDKEQQIAEQVRRQSIFGTTRPSLGEINGLPVSGPQLPLSPTLVEEDTQMLDENLNRSKDTGKDSKHNDGDASSEGTLIDESATMDADAVMTDVDEKEQQQQIFEDKENLAPTKEHFIRPPTPVISLQPLLESSPSRTNEQQRLQSPDKDHIIRSDQPMDRDMDVGQSDSTEHVPESDTLISNGIPLPTPKRPPPVPPRPITMMQKETIRSEVELGAQQDVTEVIANVLFQLECAIKPLSVDESGEQIDQIKNMFFGKQKIYTINREGITRTQEEYFSDIKIDVASGSRDLYAALDGAFDVQEVEVGGAEEPQYTTISQLPPILQILVQRAQYDVVTKTSFKSNNFLEFKETIYMDRYMDSDDLELMVRRKACWAWKKSLAALEARKTGLDVNELGLSIPEVLTATKEYLQHIASDLGIGNENTNSISSGMLHNIEAAAKHAQSELRSLDYKIKDLTANINSQFSDMRNIPYRLHSVFIHRGFVSSGHYWIYIYDFQRRMWRKYNDGYVTEINDTKEIFERDPEGRPATPYYLVYVRADSTELLVESVCRKIQIDLPEQDTVMYDGLNGEVGNLTPEEDKAYTIDMVENDADMRPGGWDSRKSSPTLRW